MAQTASQIYTSLSSDREPYLRRAEECAKYTIPFLFPEEGKNGSSDYETPYQAVGARGVNNLTAKLRLALFPPNAPFFRFDIRNDVKVLMEQDKENAQDIEQKLVQQEQVIQKYFESQQMGVTLHEALRQLVVAGNCLLFCPPKEGGIRMYKLNNYVVQRDAMGNLIQLVTKDTLARDTLPPKVLSQLPPINFDSLTNPDSKVELYTHVYLSGDRYYSYQEIDGVRLNGYTQHFPKDVCPWMPLRLIRMDGEHYSRGYVEEYIGDLKTLEGLSKALAEAAAISATVIYFVNPNGITQVSKLKKVKNGGFVPGRVEDVQALQTNKSLDMQVAKAQADEITARLSYAFMLNSAVQRQGERVTAEEIRYVANELEDTLGGIYAVLSQELQLPLVRVLMNSLQRQGLLPELPENVVQPTITTGIEAIGRGHDLTKLAQFMDMIGNNQAAMGVVNWSNIITAIANACNINTTGLIKTPEEIAQEQQQAQMMAMAQAAVPNATKGVMDGLNQQQQIGGEN